MTKALTAIWLIVPTLVITAVGVLVWKKRRSYVRVGRISKLLFYPVKSLKAVELKSGKCTKMGFEVNGVRDRSFMIVNGDGLLILQRDTPAMVFLTPQIHGKTLVISKPSGEELKVEIKDQISPEDKIINIRFCKKNVPVVDCGEEASKFLQSFLNLPSVHLVRYFPNYPIGANFPAFHLLSEASIEDLNSKLTEEHVSFYNFRPNILVEDCSAYAEDAWRYVKFASGTELKNFMMTARCLVTTTNPSTGVFSKKEPLVTLRKYRIPKDPAIIKINGSVPCFGINCSVVMPGEIFVGEDIYADVGQQPEMNVK